MFTLTDSVLCTLSFVICYHLLLGLSAAENLPLNYVFYYSKDNSTSALSSIVKSSDPRYQITTVLSPGKIRKTMSNYD